MFITFILFHPLSSSFVLFHHLSSSSILFHPLPSSFILFHPFSSSFILFHTISSSFILFHPLSSVSQLLYFSCRHVCSCLFSEISISDTTGWRQDLGLALQAKAMVKILITQKISQNKAVEFIAFIFALILDVKLHGLRVRRLFGCHKTIWCWMPKCLPKRRPTFTQYQIIYKE